jgi:hypothetical protein
VGLLKLNELRVKRFAVKRAFQHASKPILETGISSRIEHSSQAHHRVAQHNRRSEKLKSTGDLPKRTSFWRSQITLIELLTTPKFRQIHK